MKSYVFKVDLEEEDGVWSAVIPALPGCAVDAGSAIEAPEAVREAAQAYIEVLIEDGRPIHLEGEVEVVEGPAVAVVA